jgi:hypothetical protein
MGLAGGVTLKLTAAPAHHVRGFEVIFAGVAGFPVIVIVRGGLDPGVHMVVFATTVTCPVLKVGPTWNCIAVVPWPTRLLVPEGMVHIKLVAPATLETEYCTVALQTFVVGPDMDPGWLGIYDPTDLHLPGLDAQALVAYTQTGGAPVYTLGKFTEIEVVFCPETIVHPVGTVQL